jgi:hypothetical protein
MYNALAASATRVFSSKVTKTVSTISLTLSCFSATNMKCSAKRYWHKLDMKFMCSSNSTLQYIIQIFNARIWVTIWSRYDLWQHCLVYLHHSPRQYAGMLLIFLFRVNGNPSVKIFYQRVVVANHILRLADRIQENTVSWEMNWWIRSIIVTTVMNVVDSDHY